MKRLSDNITAGYMAAANKLASKKARRRIVAYVESYDDVFFWRTTALSKAGGERGLNKQLEEWLSGKYDEQLGDYLVIARCVLKSITDEMLSNPPKA